MSNHSHEKKYAGVWLDHQKAVIVDANSGEFAISRTLKSHPHHSGHSEQNHQHAAQEALRKFYYELSKSLTTYDEILLFGPGQAQEELRNQLIADKHFSGKKLHIDTAEHLTEPQMVARVRTFYAPHHVG